MSLWIAGTDEGFDKGTTYLNQAASLWELLDPQRGRRLARWLHDEWAPDEHDLDTRVYGVPSLQYLLGLLEGLGDALKAEVTDSRWRLTAERVAQFPGELRHLIDSWASPEGEVYTLANRMSEVWQLESLIKQAIAMNRPLEVRMWAVT